MNHTTEGDADASPRLPPLTLVRGSVAVLLGIHGYFRFFTGGYVPFGEFLVSQGIPFGAALALGITGFELVGPVLLLLRRFVTPVAVGHLLILIGGILLVHGPEGWFVVGGGRNGVEYSVLLVLCLVALILEDRQRTGQPPPSPPPS